jgi:hypothetical protein
MSPPFGYVFWHRPLSGNPRAAYEASLLGFQRSLKAHPPAGFLDAYSFRVERLPWRGRGSAAYEDWYLVRDFQALGDLNQAAVDAENRGPHDEAARRALGISGGVYVLRSAELRPEDARVATWLQKPGGTSYEAFLDGLSESLRGRRGALWQRQMVLGPTAEFCLHTDGAFALPRGLRGKVVRVRPVVGRGA